MQHKDKSPPRELFSAGKFNTFTIQNELFLKLLKFNNHSWKCQHKMNNPIEWGGRKTQLCKDDFFTNGKARSRRQLILQDVSIMASPDKTLNKNQISTCLPPVQTTLGEALRPQQKNAKLGNILPPKYNRESNQHIREVKLIPMFGEKPSLEILTLGCKFCRAKSLNSPPVLTSGRKNMSY